MCVADVETGCGEFALGSREFDLGMISKEILLINFSVMIWRLGSCLVSGVEFMKVGKAL